MLKTSAWLSPKLQKSGAEDYFFINAESSCLFATVDVCYERKGILHAHGVWYQDVEDHMVTHTLCNRAPERKWRISCYRMYGDFLQWSDLTDVGCNDFIYYRVPFEEVSDAGIEAYNRALERANGIENNPFT